MLALAISFCCADDAFEEKLFCTTKYLKAKGLLSSDFVVKTKYTHVSDPKCAQIVESSKKLYYETAEHFSGKGSKLANCVNEKLRQNEMAELSFKADLYEYSANRRQHEEADSIFGQHHEKVGALVELCRSQN